MNMRGPLTCPKPRRVGQLSVAPNPIRNLRWQSCHQVDPADLRTGIEFFDVFLTMGGEYQLDSSPPYFCGSPPTRSDNPVVNDTRFWEVVPKPDPILLVSPIPASGSGCTRTKFGVTPAAVRIEGFDCINHDCSRSCGIRAIA